MYDSYSVLAIQPCVNIKRNWRFFWNLFVHDTTSLSSSSLSHWRRPWYVFLISFSADVHNYICFVFIQSLSLFSFSAFTHTTTLIFADGRLHRQNRNETRPRLRHRQHQRLQILRVVDYENWRTKTNNSNNKNTIQYSLHGKTTKRLMMKKSSKPVPEFKMASEVASDEIQFVSERKFIKKIIKN